MGYRFSKQKYIKRMHRDADKCYGWVDTCDGQPVYFFMDHECGVAIVDQHEYGIHKNWCVKDDSFIVGKFSLHKYKCWVEKQDTNFGSMTHVWAECCEGQICKFYKSEEGAKYKPVGKCLATDGITYYVIPDWCVMEII